MNFLILIGVGIFVGAVSSLIMTTHGIGLVSDMILGVLGAFMGGFIFSNISRVEYTVLGEIGITAFGSLVLILLAQLMSGQQRPGGQFPN